MTRTTNMDYSSANPYEVIHSGHFMVSEFDDFEAPDDDENNVVAVDEPQMATVESQSLQRESMDMSTIIRPICDTADVVDVGSTLIQRRNSIGVAVTAPQLSAGLGYDFMTAPKHTCDTYKFGQMKNSSKSEQIDQTLSKLFRCMTLAFSDKLTSPRWRTFKGMKLRWKDKIRLNNVIWRAWHMQFIKRTSPTVCEFASPLDTDAHLKPEAVILEGIYWKRQLSTVLAEYKSWRLFFKKKLSKRFASEKEDSSAMGIDFFDWQPRSNLSSNSAGSMMVDDDSLSDYFPDNLLKYLVPNHPFAFPNPREIARVGIAAEFIQPGLVPLQPNLDEYMESFEDMFSTKLPTVVEENALSELLDATASQSNTGYVDMDMLAPVLSQRLYPQPQSEAVQVETTRETNTFRGSYLSSPSHGGQSVAMDTDVTIRQPRLPELSSLLKDDSVNYEHYANPGYVTAPKQTQPQQSNNMRKPTSTVTSLATVAPGSGTSSRHVPKLLSQMLHSNMELVETMGNGGPSPFTVTAPGCLEELLSSDGSSGNVLRRASTGHDVTGAKHKKHDVFAVPKPKLRVRSRSGPNLGQIVTNAQNVAISPSLSSSSVLVPVCTSVSTTTSFTCDPSTTVCASVSQRPSTLSELLTKGTYVRKPPQNSKTSSPVPILPSPHPSQSQAVVISPITLATVKGVNDLQNNILLSTTTQVFGNLMQPAKMLLPSGHSVSQIAPCPTPVTLTELVTPPAKQPKSKSDTVKVQHKDDRRVRHINAEQKRRCNIKNGFDMLHHLVPALAVNPNNKVSKAAMLDKAGKYIEQLKAERSKLREDAELLKEQVEALNRDINACQAQLPAGGVPINCPRPNRLQKLFEEYVRNRTTHNWKFWIFSILIRPLLDSYNSTVSTNSVDEMCKTVIAWLEQHCSLRALRPTVYNTLRHLSTTTNILSDPSRMKEEAANAIKKM